MIQKVSNYYNKIESAIYELSCKKVKFYNLKNIASVFTIVNVIPILISLIFALTFLNEQLLTSTRLIMCVLSLLLGIAPIMWAIYSSKIKTAENEIQKLEYLCEGEML